MPSSGGSALIYGENIGIHIANGWYEDSDTMLHVAVLI